MILRKKKNLLPSEKKYKTYFLELFGVLIIAFENYVLVVHRLGICKISYVGSSSID